MEQLRETPLNRHDTPFALTRHTVVGNRDEAAIRDQHLASPSSSIRAPRAVAAGIDLGCGKRGTYEVIPILEMQRKLGPLPCVCLLSCREDRELS